MARRSLGSRRLRSPQVFGVGLALASALLLAGCGSDFGLDENHIDRPQVKQFSPTLSPIDFVTLQQNPTFTDGGLTNSTHPSYPGEIVIFFNETVIDPASVYTGGDRNLGPDPSSLQILRYIPGTGNVILPLADVLVEADRIRCFPSALWLKEVTTGELSPVFGGLLADGQYSIGVFENIRNTAGKNMIDAPVFHSFTVGMADAVAPFVVTTDPVRDEENVGAGAPPFQPFGSPQAIADVRTNIFGPTSPDVIIRFNEGIASSSVTVANVKVVDAGAFVPGGGAPPQIAPAPSFPKLKSVEETSTLPSNGHEILWRPDPRFGSFPFGTTIKVTVVGSDGGANGSPIRDLAGNGMETTYEFSFRTIKPPDLPANPFPEYAVYWSAQDRVGVLDTVNQGDLGIELLAPGTFPEGVFPNALPPHTDEIANAIHLPGFDPTEISVDNRTNPATCHSYIYVISPSSSEIVVINTRTSIPVAIINTPNPGGISNQTGGGQAAEVVVVTNSSANTMTLFNVGSITPGTTFLNGPIYVQKITTTGNTPRAVAITLSPSGSYNRDFFHTGPAVPMLMYVNFTDGVVNTQPIYNDVPVRQFSMGQGSAPNDVAFTPCYVPCFQCPPIMFAAISQGGDGPGDGKISYYVAGPGCATGVTTPIRPDALIGDVGGLDGPAGLDDLFGTPLAFEFFSVAESGSQANGISTIGVVVGNVNLPRAPAISAQFHGIGASPVTVCHPAAYAFPCIGPANSFTCYVPPVPPGCIYNGTEQRFNYDFSGGTTLTTYVCCRGAGLIQAIDITSGAMTYRGTVPIPGVRWASTHGSQ